MYLLYFFTKASRYNCKVVGYQHRGSVSHRVDDTRKGGDIDLYIVADHRLMMGEKRIAFLTQLKQKIGEQRIDLVIARGTDRPIDKIAMSEGLLLCQRH